jgi:hypothetical protein
MNSLFDYTTPSNTYTLNFLMMTTATFNFRLDTLMHEIDMHTHREELIDLLRQQVEDDRNCKYSNT